MTLDQETGEILNTEAIPKVFTPFFKTPHNHDTNAESDRTGLLCLDPTKAQQQFKEETDINTIVDRFLKTGTLPPIRVPPSYQDFEDVHDFQSAMDAIKEAEASFMLLPADTRAKFNNDPGKFVAYVDYCVDNGDLGPLREMGLAVPVPPPDPSKAKTGQDPATPPTPPKGD